MMNGFLHFVRKETLHILRDVRTLLIVLLMPVTLLLLFGFAISTEVRNIDFAVYAQHPGEAVRRQVERIAANPYFTFRGALAPGKIDRALRRGDVDAVVVFGKDFGENPGNGFGGRLEGTGQEHSAQASTAGGADVRLIFDASNPNNAGTGAGYLQNILTAGETAATPEIRMLYNPQMESAYNFVPGIMGLIFVLICALMTSVSIVREKESGTMEVLLVSPVRPLRIVVAKMLPYFGLSCLDLATILLMARYVLGIPMTGSIAGIVGISVLYLTLALALGLFISTITQRQITALLCSAMLMLIPLIMLSGMIFPIENMPGILRGLSCIIPARWYIDAIRKLMIEGLPFAAVLDDFAILAAMTAVLIGVALKKFKDRLE